MLRAHSVFAAGVLLTAAVFLFPACSTTTEDGPGCSNGRKDEGEEGIDCGGICPAKCTGSACTTSDQCASGKCDNGLCGAPAGKTCGVGVATQCNDGDKCELDKDCSTGFCDAGKCAVATKECHHDGKKDCGETGIDCGGTVKVEQPCADGQGCSDNADCVGTCTNLICGPIGPNDGKKNNGETDIDCGGPNAPKCANGKDCLTKTDCVDDYCPEATKKCTAPTYDDGVQNGTETDVDCGGTGPGMKKCPETKNCLVDPDCFGACNYLKKCVDVPSCKGNFGGDTCGPGGPGTPLAANHESCCKTLEVKGYTDPIMPPGKTKVYLDKYEITAGRMRAFLEAIGGGVDAAGNAKPANVKAYMAAHRPNRWNPEWENTLPQGNSGNNTTYTITNPTGANLLYPGNDLYQAIMPRLAPWQYSSGPMTIDVGVFYSLGSAHFFPEAFGGSPPDYGASHALNCSNATGSYGYSTYWFDKATVIQYSGGTTGKGFSKEQLDEKSLTCAPFGLLAAFCAWDGGQLASAEVIDDITGNSVSSVYSNGSQNGKLAVGATNCGGTTNPATWKYITYSDGGTPCGGQGCATCWPYDYPDDTLVKSFDASARIAPPGRMPADIISKNAGDEPWMDLIGNMHEAVFKGGETKRFDYRGYGHEYGSILYHKLQQTTARGKSGSIGGRCMRFK